MIRVIYEFLRWYPYHRGELLLRGIDIIELLEEVTDEAAIDILKTIVSQDIMKENQTDGALHKSRAIINGIMGEEVDLDDVETYSYSSNGKPSDGLHQNYIEPTESGYPGLEAPL